MSGPKELVTAIMEGGSHHQRDSEVSSSSSSIFRISSANKNAIVWDEKDAEREDGMNKPDTSTKGSFARTTDTMTIEEMRYVVPPSLQWMRDNKWIVGGLMVVPLIGGLLQVTYSSINRACGAMLGAPAWGAIMSNSGASLICWIIGTPSWISGPPFKPGFNQLMHWIGEKWYTRFLVLFGGLFGGAYCLLSTYINTWIGSGLFFIFCILGQVLASLTVDTTGLMWVPKIRLIWVSYAAGAIVCVGALLYGTQNFMDMSNGVFQGTISQTILGIPLAIFAGFIYVCQACVNTEVSRHIGGTRRGLCWTYTCEVIFVVTIFVPIYPHPSFDQVTSNDWWKFCAGIFAVCGQGINMVIPIFLGFSLNSSYDVASQLISSLLFDNFGCLEGKIYKADAFRISGCIIVMVGVLIMQWAKRRALKQLKAEALELTTTSSFALKEKMYGEYNQDNDDDHDEVEEIKAAIIEIKEELD